LLGAQLRLGLAHVSIKIIILVEIFMQPTNPVNIKFMQKRHICFYFCKLIRQNPNWKNFFNHYARLKRKQYLISSKTLRLTLAKCNIKLDDNDFNALIILWDEFQILKITTDSDENLPSAFGIETQRQTIDLNKGYCILWIWYPSTLIKDIKLYLKKYKKINHLLCSQEKLDRYSHF
jgi:hypothetical protein